MKEENILDKISRLRKQGIAIGAIPEWYVTPGYQMFLEKYQYQGETVKQAFYRIANSAAKHLPNNLEQEYQVKFFDLLWKGWLAPSTPVMANMGTSRGCPVSCSGGYVGDSVYDFYDNQLETALLTKHGFGTSSYLGDVRPRGTPISSGGTASGVIPLINDFTQLSLDISQGSTRRGAWAGYLGMDHGDFFELAELIVTAPDGLNVGWVVTDDFIERLNNNDADAHLRYARALKVKCLTGKGYFFFVDRVNRANPPMYTENGLSVKASNLCLHSKTIIQVRNYKKEVFDVTIQEFVDNMYFLGKWQVKSYNTDIKSTTWENVINAALMQKNSKLMKITDNVTNKSIKCTPFHQIFTRNRGYVMAKNLKHDDKLVIK